MQKTAVVFVAHKFTSIEKQQLISFRKSLSKRPFDFYFMPDTTRHNDYPYAWLNKNNIPVITMSNEICTSVYPVKAFRRFAGTYGSADQMRDPSKAGAILWASQSLYDYVWFVEYDVLLTGGDWAGFFDSHANSDADLLATRHGTLGRNKFPDQWHWPRCDFVTAENFCAASLFIFRISSHLADLVHQKLKEGNLGHHEVFVATTAKDRGLKAENIKKSYIGKCGYFKALKISDLNRKNALYHPVKYYVPNIPHSVLRITGFMGRVWRVPVDFIRRVTGSDLSLIYSKRMMEIYSNHRDWVPDFASVIYGQFEVNSVVDMGCARGLFLKPLQDKGVKVLGIDGSEHARNNCFISRENFMLMDLRKHISLRQKYDLCISLETGAHIDHPDIDTFIRNLTQASDKVLFSSAPPEQKGYRHITCRKKEWWIKKFNARGFRYDPEITESLKSKMNTIEIRQKYYLNNLLFFSRSKVDTAAGVT